MKQLGWEWRVFWASVVAIVSGYVLLETYQTGLDLWHSFLLFYWYTLKDIAGAFRMLISVEVLVFLVALVIFACSLTFGTRAFIRGILGNVRKK